MRSRCARSFVASVALGAALATAPAAAEEARRSSASAPVPTLAAGSAPLIAAGTTGVASTWTLRAPDGGWSVGDRVEVQVGPPAASLPKSPCQAGSRVVFGSVPAISVDAGSAGADAAFEKGTCEQDTVVVTFTTAGSGTVRLSSVRYAVGDDVRQGLVAVRATWTDVGLDDVVSPEAMEAAPNARVARRAALVAESRPSIDIGDDGGAGRWRLVPDGLKRWVAEEVVTVEVADAGGACGDGARVGFAAPPTVGSGGPDVDVDVTGPGPGEGCRLVLSLDPSEDTAADPIEITGIRYRTSAGASGGPVSVAATSDRTSVDDDDAANAVLVTAPVSTTTTSGTTPTSTTPPTGVADRDGGSSAGAAVLAVLIVLTLAGMGAVARRLVVVRRPADLATVADRHLGRRRGPALADAGPSARRVSDALGGPDRAEPLLATLLWDSLDLGQPRATPVVVPHAAGTRHDLVLLDPHVKGGRPRRTDVDLDPTGYDATAVAGRLGLDPVDLQTALHEAARVGRFRMLVAAAPGVVALAGSGEPAHAVEAGGRRVASTGVAVPGPRRAFTTALHAVAGVADLRVEGLPAVVAAEHAATDSCLLEVPDGSPFPRWDNAGPLRGVSPRQNEPVRFSGASSGDKTTRVTGWDLSILAAQDVVGSKVYTPPDTVPGDSGAALFDSGRHALGFAVYVTGFGEVIQYSAWVWADQVFRALGIEGPRS